MTAQERKQRPVFSGVLKYFPKALMEVARCSLVGNEQQHPGEPLHWDRNKSTDDADALVRHLLEAGTVDTDGVRHSAKVAWRALAVLEKELEAASQIPESRMGQSAASGVAAGGDLPDRGATQPPVANKILQITIDDLRDMAFSGKRDPVEALMERAATQPPVAATPRAMMTPFIINEQAPALNAVTPFCICGKRYAEPQECANRRQCMLSAGKR